MTDMNTKLLDSNLIKHALRELKAIGMNDGEPMNKLMHDNLMELLGVFSEQGHSGFSAPYCIRLFSKLAAFEPLAPLTGADDEWAECMDGVWQNKRASHVFKDADGPYDIQAVVFREPDGICFTGKYSRQPVSFPYSPKSRYADVAKDATDEDKKAAAAAAMLVPA